MAGGESELTKRRLDVSTLGAGRFVEGHFSKPVFKTGPVISR